MKQTHCGTLKQEESGSSHCHNFHRLLDPRPQLLTPLSENRVVLFSIFRQSSTILNLKKKRIFFFYQFLLPSPLLPWSISRLRKDKGSVPTGTGSSSTLALTGGSMGSVWSSVTLYCDGNSIPQQLGPTVTALCHKSPCRRSYAIWDLVAEGKVQQPT